MTSLAVLIPFVVFAIVMTGTPGPNNAMVLLSGARVGIARTLPLVSGISVGVGLQFALLGLGLGAFIDAVPGFKMVIAFIGTTYIFWLSWKIATSGPLAIESHDKPPMGALGGAAFQWINPKAWAVSISAAATYVPVEDYHANLSIAAVLLALVTFPCVGLWAFAGVTLRRALTRRRTALAFNVSMAIVLVLATLPPILRLVGVPF